MRHTASKKRRNGTKPGEGTSSHGEIEIGLMFGVKTLGNTTLSNILKIAEIHRFEHLLGEPKITDSYFKGVDKEILIPLALHTEETEYSSNESERGYFQKVADMKPGPFEERVEKLVDLFWRNGDLPEEIRWVKSINEAYHTIKH